MRIALRGKIIACTWIHFLICFNSICSAASISLFFNDSQTDSAEIFTGELSTPLTIGVFNSDSNVAVEDFLTAWQVSLEIEPQSGATGSLSFVSATEPLNYSLSGANAGISVINSGDSLFAFDFNFPSTGGVQIPTEPGSPLLSFQVQASDDASGDFGIFALSGLGESEWTDASPGIQSAQKFANVPVGLGRVLIGNLSVNRRIPEPSSVLVAAIATLTIVFGRRYLDQAKRLSSC